MTLGNQAEKAIQTERCLVVRLLLFAGLHQGGTHRLPAGPWLP
jgi:hypothetical protein